MWVLMGGMVWVLEGMVWCGCWGVVRCGRWGKVWALGMWEARGVHHLLLPHVLRVHELGTSGMVLLVGEATAQARAILNEHDGPLLHQLQCRVRFRVRGKGRRGGQEYKAHRVCLMLQCGAVNSEGWGTDGV